jgi:hypothetical protein
MADWQKARKTKCQKGKKSDLPETKGNKEKKNEKK